MPRPLLKLAGDFRPVAENQTAPKRGNFTGLFSGKDSECGLKAAGKGRARFLRSEGCRPRPLAAPRSITYKGKSRIMKSLNCNTFLFVV